MSSKRISLIIMVAMLAMAVSAKSPKIIVPKALKPGSRIALVTPASAIKDVYIDTVIVKLRAQGYEPVVFPNAYGQKYGSYAATDEERAGELMSAFTDKSIDAILCTRGGYGCVRLLPLLDVNVIRKNPKWLIGYSDISDLHALMYLAGVASIHGPMAAHISTEPDSLASTQYLYQVLSKGLPMQYDLAPNAYNKTGKAKGRLVGGNLLTINGLSETPYDFMNPEKDEDLILFIEDIDEQIYAIERVLMRMHLNGSLKKLKGLIIGQFTNSPASKDFKTTEHMIYYWLKKWGYYDDKNPMPIVFDFPTGHVSENYPMIVGAVARLTVTPDGTVLRLSEK